MEPIKITVKKPIWSTEVVGLDGIGCIIHNYADGTNSGPIPIDRRGIHFMYPRDILAFRKDIDGDLSQDSDTI